MAAISQKEKSLQPSVGTVRNYGIDALRLVSMLFIVIHHTIVHGGVLNPSTGIYRYVVQLINVAVYCAVDCYALISGYVGYTETPKPFKSSKYITLWLQVAFYSIGFTVLLFFFQPQAVGLKELFKSFFPVSTKAYWYFSAYTAVFFMVPFLNEFIRNISKSNLTKLIAVIFSLFSGFMVFAARIGGDPFSLYSGYSAIWLVILYIIGAWIKKCEIPNKIKSSLAWAIIAVLVIVTWLLEQIISPSLFIDLFSRYTSPIMVLIAVGYVVIFSKFEISKGGVKWIKFLAPSAFGVYLIHDQNYVRELIMHDRFVWILEKPIWSFPLWILASALAVFVIGLLIETVRRYLFRFVGIDRLCQKIGKFFDGILHRVSKRTERYFEK